MEKQKSEPALVRDSRPVELSGTLELLPNPCLSKPCLPGQVYALVHNDASYVLSQKDKWFWGHDAFVWNASAYAVGDAITVKGRVIRREDVNQKDFYQLEIETLSPR